MFNYNTFLCLVIPTKEESAAATIRNYLEERKQALGMNQQIPHTSGWQSPPSLKSAESGS